MILHCPFSCIHLFIILTISFFKKKKRKKANIYILDRQCSLCHKYTLILEIQDYSHKTLNSSQALHSMLPIYFPNLPLCPLIPCLPATNQLFVLMSSYLHLEFIFSSLLPRGKNVFQVLFLKGQTQTIFSPGRFPNICSMRLSTSSLSTTLSYQQIIRVTALKFSLVDCGVSLVEHMLKLGIQEQKTLPLPPRSFQCNQEVKNIDNDNSSLTQAAYFYIIASNYLLLL